jgi:integrase
MPKREWRGSVKTHGGYLSLQVKDDAGQWIERGLDLKDTPANRRLARQKLAEYREAMLARAAALGGAPGPATVRAYAKKWMEDRRASGIADVENDDQRLRDHVLPFIGDKLLEEVKPRHLVEIVEAARKGHAPRTVRNIYYLARALFRDAEVAELIELGANPCILTKRQLGKMRDAKTGWRQKAIYTRAELELLLSSEKVPHDRRVWYGLLALGMLRTGEAAGLLWRSLELDAKPLGRIAVATSYDDGLTKTEVERWMPIHPTLAGLLAEWKLGGFEVTFHRAPQPDDLVCPVPYEPPRKGRVRTPWSMRDKNYAWKRLQWDLEDLELRGRRAHDLRRTGISLARGDGASKEILRWGTHAPPRDVMDLYTTLEWEALCGEVAKLRVTRTAVGGGMVLPLWQRERS